MKYREGRWYWTTSDGKTWSPALRDSSAAGGWRNNDTWEDFTGEVRKIAVLIPLPEEITELQDRVRQMEQLLKDIADEDSER